MYFTSTSLVEFHPTSSHFSLQSELELVVTDLSQLNSSNQEQSTTVSINGPEPNDMTLLRL